MFFEFRNRNKTVKELRKNQGYTAKELASKIRVDTPVIMKIDNLRLKDVPEPLRSKVLPILRGDYMEKIPW
jgi:ribosome-binding protein aMBF1 (putative translation factor)